MPYPHHIIDVTRKLRKNATPAERLLWQHLRNRKLGGLKFGRQHPFGRYVADFYCAELKLIVEIEGGIHDEAGQQEHDRVRFEELELRGLRILRFSNSELLQNTRRVLQQIVAVKNEVRKK
jgi:very-short-patch-repair endonuclease